MGGWRRVEGQGAIPSWTFLPTACDSCLPAALGLKRLSDLALPAGLDRVASLLLLSLLFSNAQVPSGTVRIANTLGSDCIRHSGNALPA